MFSITKNTFVTITLFTCSQAMAAEINTIDRPYLPQVTYSNKTIGSPAALAGAYGFKVGPDGQLYVTSVPSNEIAVMDPITGEVTKRIRSDRYINGPDDLVFGPDGSLYWTESGTGQVGVLRPDGSFAQQKVANFLNPIAMNEEGRIFAAASFFGKGLYEIDPELKQPPRTVIADIEELNGFEFGPDGYLYAPKLFSGAIVRIDVDTGEVTEVANGFNTPSGIEFNIAGDMFVLDSSTGLIAQVNPETGEVTPIVEQEGLWDNLAFDDQDQLYVSSVADGQVYRLTSEQQLEPLNPAGLVNPGGLAVAANGDIWVADNHAMKHHGADGSHKDTFYGSIDPEETGYSMANTVDIVGDQMLVTGWADFKVQVRDPSNGQLIKEYSELEIPTHATIYQDEVIATQANIGYGGVIGVEENKRLMNWIILPTGLTSDDNHFYVADWLLGSIYSMDESGQRRLVAAGLDGPEGITVAGNWLFVVEGNANRVSVINLRMGIAYPLIEFDRLSYKPQQGAIPWGTFNDVAVKADHTKLYVSSDWSKSVYEFDLSLP